MRHVQRCLKRGAIQRCSRSGGVQKDLPILFRSLILSPAGAGVLLCMDLPGDSMNEAVFLQITPLKTIVWDRLSQPLFQVSVHFEPGDKTLLLFNDI